jgi:hypothetical protein
MSSKNELLDELESIQHSQETLSVGFLINVLMILGFIGLLFFPKIYITQQIYFKSRDIAKLKSEYDTLKEENKIISGSVEEIKFKNQILDTLF